MSMRVIVIGGGIVGASIACNLARRGDARVTLLEMALPASGATSKSFSWINANFAETLDYFRLRKAGIDEYRSLADRCGVDPGIKWGGSLWWESGGSALARHARELEDYGYDARIIDADTFSKLEPAVASPPGESIHSVEEAAIDPVAITNRLLFTAAKHGADIVSGCSVVGFRKSNGRFTGVDTTAGQFHADCIAVAAGVWSEPLLAKAGIRLPMDNRSGLIVHTHPVGQVLNHLVMSPEIHFRQEIDGRIIVGEIFSGGGLHENQVDTDPLDLAADILKRLKIRLPTVKGLEIGAVMLGKRPVPVDGFPAVGPPEGGAGLYIATMHSGITLGPIIGRLAADEILDGTQSELLESFRPTRFKL